MLENEWQCRFQGWEIAQKRDSKTGQIVTTVDMPPVPGLEQLLATAEKMYEFVNKYKS